MNINDGILRFYQIYLAFNIYFFPKLMHSNQNLLIYFFSAKRDGLVTEFTFNKMWTEGCNEMKKMSSCHKGMSKLSESQNQVLSLTRVNSFFYTGSTLPQHDNNKLRKCIISFSGPEFRREDSGLSIYTCTEKSLTLLRRFIFFSLTSDYIIIKYGNPGKYSSLTLIFFKHSYSNIFHTLNILSSLKCCCSIKVYNILGLHQTISRRHSDCQEVACRNGGKKLEKANGLGNSRYTFSTQSNVFIFENMLNSLYLNLNQKVSYRQYCAQNLPSGDRLNCAIREWPNSKLLVKFKEEVTQEQIALVDLAKLKGLHSEAVKRRQTILLRSLKFRVIAVYKISKSNDAKTPGVDNISFIGDAYANKKKYWNITEQLKKIILNSKKYKPLPVKRVWLPKTRHKKRPIGIPTVLDRALQQLICLVLEPLVEFTSDSNSFGFREYRSAKMAIGVLRELLKTIDENYIQTSSFKQIEQGVPLILHEDKWILDADIEGFFDNINHEYLLTNLFLPPIAIDLVKSLLICGIIDKHIFTISDSGVPQGGILSPVLANFTLNGLQDVVYKAIYPLTKSKARRIQISDTDVAYPSYLEIVRYADDFVVLCCNKFILKFLIIPEINKFLQKRGLRLSSAKTKLFRLKDGIKLKFLGYNFHYENKWKVKNKFMYSNHVGSRAIALYPDKFKVNSLIKKLKQIFKKSLNLDAYNLIAKLNPRLRKWGSYFNLGNCARYRSLIKNLVYKMCWKWAHRKHKRWGGKKIAEFYFLTKQKRKKTNKLETTKDSEEITHKRKQKFQKTKNLKWSFHGSTKSNSRHSKSSKKSKTIHLYNIVEKGTTVSALTYRVPQNLRKIHAYHSDILKFIEWSVKANQKAMGPFSNRKISLYKKQKGFCFICKTPFTEQELFNNKTHIHHVTPISKGGRPDLDSNMVLVHSLCHRSIDH